ncbi:head-tail connector protein [Martelella alba]|uniref:Phage gp6-like head-tail connector protein n=1 Tax=Martelella alba TaxID=2590451 RepID=A0ABY2SEZ2_9HYPH|nr:head-tail connector protein [Martelella alba]TKI02670.1 phage gp6-like head-tail connector protein [Martelella alba]
MIPTPDQLRAQCRIDDDDTSSDALLTLMAAAARRKAENFINRPLYDDEVPEDEDSGLVVTEDIALAILLAVGHWYINREAAASVQQLPIPLGFNELLEPYRIIPL